MLQKSGIYHVVLTVSLVSVANITKTEASLENLAS